MNMSKDGAWRFSNEEVVVFVTTHPKGYAVSLKDADCDEFLPTVQIYKSLEDAVRFAEKCVR